MRCRIRNLFRSRTGSLGFKEEIVEVDGHRVRLGRGTENDVFLGDLRVNYRHAEIVVREHDVIIEAIGESIIRVDGVPTDRGAMTPATEVEVGPYRIQLQDEAGADLTLAIELIAPAPTDGVDKLIDPKRIGIGGSRRSLSWVLFVAAIVGTLVLPMVAHLLFKPGTTAVVERAGAADTPRSRLASLDSIWSSGPLSSAHKSLEGRCEVCHEQAFVMVRNESCGACHDRVQHHFDLAAFSFDHIQGDDCTACHDEHLGPEGVIPARQQLCADCHADLDQTHPETALLDAADFGDAHLEFRPSVIVDPATGEIVRASLGSDDFPNEASNLLFPHDVHLADACTPPDPGAPADQAEKARQACTIVRMAGQRMNRPEGLGCGDCHVPEPGGVNMLPVNMQDHCADCHRLEFDPDAPGRVLPHGQPDEVIAVINDYYAAKALRAGTPEAVEVVTQAQALRRRPGGETAGQAPAATPAPAPDPVAEATFVSDQKLEDVFGRSLCGVCHETEAPAESARGVWEVRPVRVTPLWMPKAHFDHAAHQTVPCGACHAAETSAASTDVLMPGIEGCRDCHQGEATEAALPSTCIMCHVYHRDELEPMLPKRELAATGGS
jgi:predicted CXXCH cytochrome family protein